MSSREDVCVAYSETDDEEHREGCTGNDAVDCTWPGDLSWALMRQRGAPLWLPRRPRPETECPQTAAGDSDEVGKTDEPLREAMMRSGDCRSAKQARMTWTEDAAMSEVSSM